MEKYKPIIGIIARVSKVDNKNVMQVGEEYRLSIVKAGGIPIVIVPTNDFLYELSAEENVNRLSQTNKEDILKILKLCDGFLMIGGTRWYEYDEFICKYVIDNNIPILGICLGMQILANIDNFCGTNNSDQTIVNNTKINHCQENQNYVHSIRIVSNKFKRVLHSDMLLVNSRHKFHVVDKPFFNICAYSEDDLIEAIEIPICSFAFGVQWHPESMLSYEPVMLEIFNALIEKAIQYRINKK